MISYVFSLLGLTAALEVENSFLQLRFCWSPAATAAAVRGRGSGKGRELPVWALLEQTEEEEEEDF